MATSGAHGRFRQSKGLHVRQRQRPCAQAGPVRQACRTLLGDVAERIGTEIAIGLRIRSPSDAKGIKNKQECTRHEIYSG